VAWRKQPGDRVERGEIVADVETDKGAIEVEIFTCGVIERLLVEPGAKVPVGTVLATVREDGEPKPAMRRFYWYTPEMGLCQWFHYEDHRLDDAVRHMKDLGVTYLRTGLSWADSLRPDADAWFDHLMSALEPFAVTATFCFTPDCLGVEPHHTSPPREVDRYADFCARMVRKYAS
jgi:pyruvate/2-oxoglutarate dehydrogenase complex dihydrolipoamide acyltransferase (E2) component